ncbi:hypothetical protein [Helicobacter pametensis]|uniref:hypothetical protein n=1 Tax=Helicobacter pametensis TaxID=95149 RepID=UPI00048927B8|nr:hypothetical protein [Helicobacter pametensis]
MLDQYNLGFLERTLIKWQTRALGPKFEKMIILLPVFVRIGGNENLERCVQNVRRIIFTHIKSRRVAVMVFRRIMFRAKKYYDNEESFYEAKQKVYEMITQNIQMFSLVLDALEGIDRELGRSMMIVKRNYEEAFEMTSETRRLLKYQERRYFELEESLT